MKSSPNNKKRQTGFTMIESLVTLFILTIGLLGIAGMQMEGLRSGGLAMQRIAVVIKAQEMMERIRAASVDRTALQPYFDVFASTSAADHGCNVSGTYCNATAMAENDVFMWQRDLEILLPDLTGAIATPAGDDVTVSINWKDRGVDQSYSITALMFYEDS